MIGRWTLAGLGVALTGSAVAMWIAAACCAADAPAKPAAVAGAAPSKPGNAKTNGKTAADNDGSQGQGSQGSQGQGEDIVEIMGSNAACCVCHMTFLKEEMAKSHLKAKVGCVKCHGTSAAHANDEHIGATKPDVVFKRNQIDPSCVKCHEVHNASARVVIARFVERKLPASPQPTCTECHGMHRIDKALEAQLKSKQ